MKNKILAIIAAIAFSVFFVAQSFLLVNDANQLIFEVARYASLIFQVIGGGLLLYFSGSFRRTIWRRIANFGIATFLIGMLFKLQHWPGGPMLMNIGVATCLLCYIIHFIKKSNKTLKDASKLGWLISISSAIILSLYHFEYVGYLNIAGNSVLAVAVAIHMKEMWNAKPINNNNQSAIFDN